jgi:hypothetical protein
MEDQLLDVSEDGRPLITRATKATAEYSVLHRRLFHVGHQSLASMIRKEIVKDINFTAKELKLVDSSWFPHCAPCNMGKMVVKHPHSHHEDATCPLWRLHGDVCTYPGGKPGRKGELYLMSLYDEFSQAGKVRAIKTKDQATPAMMEMIKELEAEAPGYKVHRVRLDGGGEFGGYHRAALLSANIVHEPTAPHLHEQNGTAEAFNKRILGMVRSALAESGLPHTLWPQCAESACHVHNRIAVGGRSSTPWERLTGNMPSISHLRVWGCQVTVHVPLETQSSKLAPRAELGRFVGYDEHNPKAWYVLVDGVIKLRGGVIFDERPKWGEYSHGYGGTPSGAPIGSRVAFRDPHLKPSEVLVLPEAPPPVPTALSERQTRPVRAAAAAAPANYSNNNRIIQSPAPLGIQGRKDPSVEEQDDSPMEEGVDEELGDHDKLGDDELGDDWMSANGDELGDDCYMMHVPYDTMLSSYPIRNFSEDDDYEPVSFMDAMNCRSSKKWDKAVQEEMKGLSEMNTFELVPRLGSMKPLPSKWVFRLKRGMNGEVERHKARLVVKGYRQREGVDFNEVFAPVGSSSALRVLMARAAQEDWHIHQTDFKQAFLNAKLSEDVYLEIPDGYPMSDAKKGSCVLHLLKSLYGLKQAPREWYLMLKAALLGMGFKQSDADPGIFYRDGVYLLLYVDDQLIMGPDIDKIQDAIKDIAEQFVITDMGPAKMFLGVEIVKGPKYVKLTQQRYTQSLLVKYASTKGKVVPTPAIVHSRDDAAMNVMAESQPYAELVGSLLYLSTWTRPDISFAVGRLTKHMQSPRLIDWTDALRVLNYLKGTADHGITFRQGGGDLVGYSDSDYATDSTNGKSVTGMVFMMNGGPICWKSKQQSTVAVSTCEAELNAATTTAKEAMWLRKLLPELGVPMSEPVECLGDNLGALQLIKHPVLSTKSKHIRQSAFYAREVTESNEIRFTYVNTAENLADIFTKACEPKVFVKLRDEIMMNSPAPIIRR